MNIPAFYLPELVPPLVLSGAEAEHAHVLRLKENQKIIVLDGRGATAVCRIVKIAKNAVHVEQEDRLDSPPPVSRAIVALALSKAARRGFFMEKAAEFGAWEIWLWEADHSQGKLGAGVERACRAQLIAGMKQCKNPWLPQLRVHKGIDSIIGDSGAIPWRILPWEKQVGVPPLEPSLLGRDGMTIYVIGPEGGFSERELSALDKADFRAVSLGQRILRCETAASLCLGLHWWASQLPRSQKDEIRSVPCSSL